MCGHSHSGPLTSAFTKPCSCLYLNPARRLLPWSSSLTKSFPYLWNGAQYYYCVIHIHYGTSNPINVHSQARHRPWLVGNSRMSIIFMPFLYCLVICLIIFSPLRPSVHQIRVPFCQCSNSTSPVLAWYEHRITPLHRKVHSLFRISTGLTVHIIMSIVISSSLNNDSPPPAQWGIWLLARGYHPFTSKEKGNLFLSVAFK